MKKALIFNPYLDTLGGGEFYGLSVGQFLLTNNFRVEIAWNNENVFRKINERFNITSKFICNKNAYIILKSNGKFWGKYLLTKKYDFILYFSDGSIPFLAGKKNWLLFQAPFVGVNGRGLINQLKFNNIHKVICYSNFVKRYIDKEYNVKSQVLFPPIAEAFFQSKAKQKENIILSVGRFDQIMNAKKQDVLIKVFIDLVKEGLKGWRLVLLGGLLEQHAFIIKLKNIAKGYPIDIFTNVSFKTLLDYYQKSKIYWHAAGYGENLEIYPQRAEHFGIAVVEAMASGAIPLIFKGGGLTEIIRDDQLLWQTLPELEQKTKWVINNKQWVSSKLKTLLDQAREYNYQEFINKLKGLL